jgi:chemotaxis family two-component system response regulator PixH
MATALVVDDTVTEREILKSFLTEAHFDVVIAITGEEALEKAGSTNPNVIILDVVLPGKSGFEVCRELKEQDATKNIPVIICSTKNTEMDKFWGLKQGADGYVTKPVNKEELLEAVKKLVK